MLDALLQGADAHLGVTLGREAVAWFREDWKRLGYVPLGALAVYGLLRPASVRPSGTPARTGAGTPDAPDGTGGSVRALSGLDAFRRGAKRGKAPCLAAPHFALRSVGILHGPSGEGKSRWLSEVVYALLRGADVFGWATRQTAAVWITEEPLSVWKGKAALILPPEELAWPWWRRLLRWAFPRRFPPTVWVISLPDSGYVPSLEAFRALCGRVRRLAERTGAQLIIGDTVMALCPQAVADNTTAKVFMMAAHALAAQTGAAVELVHHDNDGGKPLGAKMIKGDADFTHHVSRLPKAREDDRRRVVTFGKRYEPFAPPPLVYAMGDDGRLYPVRPRTDAPERTDGVAESTPAVFGSSHPAGEGAHTPPLRLVPPPLGPDGVCGAIVGFLRTSPPPAPWTRPTLRDAIMATKMVDVKNRGTVYAHLGHLLEAGLLVEAEGVLRLREDTEEATG